MQNFLNEPHAAPPTEGFIDSAVEQALSRMHQGASGLDGTSKKWIHPLRTALITIMTALFSYVYLHCATLSAWSLAVIEKEQRRGRQCHGWMQRSTNLEFLQTMVRAMFERPIESSCLSLSAARTARVLPGTQDPCGFYRTSRDN